MIKIANKQASLFIKNHYSILFSLIFGSAITLIAMMLIRDQEILIAKLEFTKQANYTAQSVQRLFTNSLNVTSNLAAFLYVSREVRSEDFTIYANKLIELQPDIQALEWVPKVDKAILADFNKRNKLKMHDFNITEKDNNGQLIPVLDRPSYFPVQFVVPIAGNKKAIGYDISSNKVRKKMLIKAVESHHLTASSRVKLVQEKGNSFGILVTLPVFKQGNSLITTAERNKNLRGYALGVYRINSIIEQSLSTSSYIPSSFRLIDKSAASHESLLYQSESSEKVQSDWFRYIDDTFVAGRNYSIQISEKPEYFLTQFRFSTLILLAGLVLTILTSIYISLIQKRNMKLRQSNQNLHEVMDEIKTLKGIIPICSYCHSIRDDEGAWEQLELYISRYSKASFSHGICPKCMVTVRAEAGLEE